MANKVYLVGAGPGDPDLITVKGQEILRQADVVIYDYLVDKRLLEEVKEGAELICCDKPVRQWFGFPDSQSHKPVRQWFGFPDSQSHTLGKTRHPDGFLIHNEKINQLVIKKAKEGKKVVRLKNGDPGIFSRTSQELESLLKENIEFEIVPGVTAASGASCFSGIPLTDRRFASSCVFVTGHEDPTKNVSSIDWNSLSKSGTIVLYMAVENLSKIVKELIKAGKSFNTPAAIIQDASLITQKVLTGTLKDIVSKAKAYKVKPPAIIIIGEVVKLGRRFNWLKKHKRILFTGISAMRFFENGFIFHLPLIKIISLKDYSEFDAALKNIPDYDWIVFCSRYGVQYFFQRLNKIGYDARKFSQAKIAAIGKSTANRLLDFGIIADLIPKEESSRALIGAFKKIDIKEKKIFMPRSDLSDKGLSLSLESQGARVTSCVAYKNVMPKNLPDLDLKFFDEIMFSSPSGVRNFIRRYAKPPKKIKLSYIGEVTKREARRWHLSD